MKKMTVVFGKFIVLVCLIIHPVYAQNNQSETDFEEEAAVFDEETAEDNGQESEEDILLQEIKQKFNLKLYLDFMYEESIGSDDDTDLREADEPSFSTNHTYLMLQASPTDKLRVGFDIQFNNFFEIEYSPIPKVSLKVGKILLPFGDYHYHPIYGGKAFSLDNDLFPNWFTDYGMAFGHQLLDTDYFTFNYDLFVSNGFQNSSDGDLNMNAIGYANDNNSEKAFGGRIKSTWFGAYDITASGMYDSWDNDSDATLGLWALDFSTSSGIVDLPVLKHFNMKLGYLDKHVENDSATDAALQEYDGFGSFAELNVKPINWLKLVCRVGEVDPNEDVQDKMDQRNYNIHSIFYLEQYLELWVMYQRNEEKYVDEIDNDYAFVKVVLSY
ncbi:MAG: hypothetical protein PVI90_09970 [Desulfobacteraceae bacterium]|jgi:hypothetical protein